MQESFIKNPTRHLRFTAWLHPGFCFLSVDPSPGGSYTAALNDTPAAGTQSISSSLDPRPPSPGRYFPQHAPWAKDLPACKVVSKFALLCQRRLGVLREMMLVVDSSSETVSEGLVMYGKGSLGWQRVMQVQLVIGRCRSVLSWLLSFLHPDGNDDMACGALAMTTNRSILPGPVSCILTGLRPFGPETAHLQPKHSSNLPKLTARLQVAIFILSNPTLRLIIPPAPNDCEWKQLDLHDSHADNSLLINLV
ncbi:hypothetical protein S40288_10756 [Stachybotrys chartarum IBT 40288]|nr:hypothetical protein S40288_10756 [Stachybotrys chartarum IBT 40288]